MEKSETFITASEIRNRIEKLQERLRAREIEAALILQNADLYYFAGSIQQGQLYVPAEGEPLLMVRKSFDRAVSESPIEKILPLKSPRMTPEILKENGAPLPRTIGMELDVLPANLYFSFGKIFPKAEIKDISHEIRSIRAVKSAFELDCIREAAKRSDQLSDSVRDMIREGMTELELAGLVEAKARAMGHQGIVRMRLWGSELFYGHLMAGPGAAVPSFLASPTGGVGASPAVAQGASHQPIRRNEPILVDYTFAYNGYISDHTRIFVIGELPDDLVKGFEAMLQVQERVKAEAKASVSAGTVYEIACQRAEELGVSEHFMGTGKERIRFVGHGVGLELDEYPFLAKGQGMILATDMVIALEPKLIIPGKGVVGIENTHRVTQIGLEQLTHFKEEIIVV